MRGKEKPAEAATRHVSTALFVTVLLVFHACATYARPAGFSPADEVSIVFEHDLYPYCGATQSANLVVAVVGENNGRSGGVTILENDGHTVTTVNLPQNGEYQVTVPVDLPADAGAYTYTARAGRIDGTTMENSTGVKVVSVTFDEQSIDIPLDSDGTTTVTYTPALTVSEMQELQVSSDDTSIAERTGLWAGLDPGGGPVVCAARRPTAGVQTVMAGDPIVTYLQGTVRYAGLLVGQAHPTATIRGHPVGVGGALLHVTMAAVYLANGDPIVDGQNNFFCVGQHISLIVKLTDAVNYQIQGPFDSVQWTVGTSGGSAAIRNYALTGAPPEALTAADLHGNPGIQFYYLKAGTPTVSADVFFHGRHWPQRSKTLNVEAPMVVSLLRTHTGTVGLGNWDTYYGLHSGGASEVGMEVTCRLTGPGHFDGQVGFVQLVKSDRSYIPIGGGAAHAILDTAGDYWLDNTAPYPGGGSLSAGTTASFDTNGTPGQEVLRNGSWSRVDLRDDFQMFVLYKPGGAGSVWVPVGRLDWGWGATAESPNGITWNMTGGAQFPSSTSTWPDAPQWQAVARNVKP